MDHVQRHMINAGGEFGFPARIFASTNVHYGSGFSNGNSPPDHPPGHATADVTLGKDFGERFSASVTALNVGNQHLFIDNGLTFGGTHYKNPREIYVHLRYRFHY